MAVLLAVAALLSSQALALSTRTLTGRAILPDGSLIASGKLIATPYGSSPSSTAGGLLLQRPQTYTITSGVLVCSGACTIVAPANYTFSVYVTESGKDKPAIKDFQAGVEESASAITMQDLYASATTAVVVASDPVYAGEVVTQLTSPVGSTDGHVLTVQSDGTTVAFEAPPSNPGDIEGVTAGTGLSGGGTTGTVTVSLANTAVSPGSYTLMSGTVDAQGRLTAASSGAETGDISGVTAGTGLTGGGSSGAVTVTLADTAVSPGSYTYSAITVDQQGRITAASSGAAPAAEADTLATVTARGASTATNTTFTGTLTRGTPVTADATASTVLAASSATDTPLVVQGAAAQSANLFEVQDSTGSAKFYVLGGTVSGAIVTPGAYVRGPGFSAGRVATFGSAGTEYLGIWDATPQVRITSLSIGDGYGSTGATISDAGALSLDGGLIRGTPVTADATASSVFAAQSATDTPLVVQGAAGQTANLFEAQDSTGAVKANIDPAGTIAVGNVAGNVNSVTISPGSIAITTASAGISIGASYATAGYADWAVFENYLTRAPIMYAGKDFAIQWANSSQSLGGSPVYDIGLSRASAGVLKVTNGSTGDGAITAATVTATTAAIIPSGAAPGATCTVGQIFIDLDETDDTNCATTLDNSLCICTATNTWTALEN